MLKDNIYKALFEQASIGLAINSLTTGAFIQVNASFAKITGYSLAELNALSYWDLTPKQYAEQEQVQLEKLAATGQYGPYIKHYVNKSGRHVPVRLSGCKIASDDGQTLILSTVEDISGLQRTKDKLELASLVIKSINEAIVIINKSYQIEDINPAFKRMTDYRRSDLDNLDITKLLSPKSNQLNLQEINKQLIKGGHWSGEVWLSKKSGLEFPCKINVSTIRNSLGKITYYIMNLSDITEQLNSRKQLWTQANYDSLTGLANRKQFTDRLGQMIEDPDNPAFTLLFIDIDEFKEVNDTYGHALGDKLLALVAKRFYSSIRKTDLLARLGGDEFTVILYDVKDNSIIEKIGNDILENIAKPFTVENQVIHISVSIGIVKYPEDAVALDALLQHADEAMYSSKEQGKNRFSYFNQNLHNSVTRRLYIANELRKAVELEQFELYFQPIYCTKTKVATKVEVLIRWHHQQSGFISPAEFIPIAEKVGLINKIGGWVMEQVVALLINHTFKPNFKFSINISAHQLDYNNLAFWDEVLKKVKKHQLAENIIIEITESNLIDPSEYILGLFKTFQQEGIEVAVDDFGTGYSSLSYLKQFDIDYLKIDKSFVENIDVDSSNQVLTEAMIIMAQKLGLQVICEGVETKSEYQMLKSMNSDYCQGFHLSKPISQSKFLEQYL